MAMMKQCVLSSGTVERVCWVEEYLAKVGKTVVIDEEDEIEGVVWRIMEVFPHSFPKESLQERKMKFKNFSYGHQDKKSGLPN